MGDILINCMTVSAGFRIFVLDEEVNLVHIERHCRSQRLYCPALHSVAYILS